MRACAQIAMGVASATGEGACSVRARWRSRPPWWDKWIANILVGAMIEIALVLGGATRVVTSAQNWAVDTSMQAWAAVNPQTQSDRLISAIDIDEETWRSPEWGDGQPEPDRAPRDKLNELIRYAIGRGAQNVIVDIIIEDPSLGNSDQIFTDNMANLAATISKSGRHIFFVRTLRDSLIAPDVLAPVLKTSPLDRAIDGSNGALVKVAPYFETSRDGVVRRWRLWTTACQPYLDVGQTNPLGEWRVLPSVQLAVQTADQKIEDAPWAASGRLGTCRWSRKIPVTAAKAGNEILIGKGDVDAKMSKWLARHPSLLQPNKHLMTFLAETPSKPAAKGQIDAPKWFDPNGFDPSSHILFHDTFPPSGARIQTVSALKIVQLKQGLPTATDLHMPSDWGDTVIIGQSTEAAHDMHVTPLGAMPGYLVIANALLSLRLDAIEPLRKPVEWFLRVTTIVAIGFVFAVIESSISNLIVGILFGMLMIIFSYVLLTQGIWFDFAVPLIGISMHRILEKYEDYFSFRHLFFKNTNSPHAHPKQMRSDPK